ncbi:MAG: glycosyltransferase family 4 protein [Planctomycetota bacterium]
MKVCFVANQIAAWGKIGGFGVNLRRLGNALVGAGVEVHVVVPRRRGQGAVEPLDGMTVHGISWAAIFAGSPVYRNIDADIYHLQEPTFAGFWAQRAMRDRIHLVTSMDPRDSDDWYTEFRHATWQRRLKAPAQWFYEDGALVRQTVRAADGVYVEAECLREKAQRHYRLPALPDVLPKPVPIPAGPFVKATRPLCAFVARLDPRKRPEVMIEIARLVPEYDFVIVGRAHDASYQRHLECLFQGIPNLEVTGFLDPFDNQRMFHILSRAWVLVHPAQREGLATAFQEASVHEAAILAQVDPGGYVTQFGRVLPPTATAAEWAAALRLLVESGDWKALGQAGRVYNIEHHAIDVSLARHLDVYRNHLNH